MATKRFTGYLREPLSEYAQHDLWRFTHATTTGEVVKGSTSMFKVDEDGYYDIEIQYGTVMIESKDRLSQRWINHGQYTISSATTVTTLPALLLATTPMTPELQQELEAILADAQEARDQTVALFDSVDGDFIYHNKNAVGSVSQSGGVPTGGLMDWGVTPNGAFNRLADGTIYVHINNLQTNLIGQDFGRTAIRYVWTFPYPMSSSPSGIQVTFGSEAPVGGGNILDVDTYRTRFTGRLSSVEVWVYLKDDKVPSAGDSIPINISATGRWF